MCALAPRSISNSDQFVIRSLKFNMLALDSNVLNNILLCVTFARASPSPRPNLSQPTIESQRVIHSFDDRPECLRRNLHALHFSIWPLAECKIVSAPVPSESERETERKKNSSVHARYRPPTPRRVSPRSGRSRWGSYVPPVAQTTCTACDGKRATSGGTAEERTDRRRRGSARKRNAIASETVECVAAAPAAHMKSFMFSMFSV